MDKVVLIEFANSIYWKELENHIEGVKEGIKTRLVSINADDLKSIANLQGRFEALSALQGLVNKFKED